MMLSPEMNHSVAPSGHNFAEAMLLRGHAPPGFPPSPFAAAATMDHQRVSCRYLMSTNLTTFYYIVIRTSNTEHHLDYYNDIDNQNIVNMISKSKLQNLERKWKWRSCVKNLRKWIYCFLIIFHFIKVMRDWKLMHTVMPIQHFLHKCLALLKNKTTVIWCGGINISDIIEWDYNWMNFEFCYSHILTK